MRFFPIVFSAALATPAISQAQDEEIEEGEIIIIGTPIKNDEDSRNQTGFSEKLNIKNQVRPIADTGDLLRSASGVTVRDEGGAGRAKRITLRGVDAQQVSVFIDDLPLSGSRGGAFDLASLPVSFLESVELLRGAQGAYYGSGAQGGVVHLRTQESSKKRINSGKLQLRAGQGSWFTLDGSLDIEAEKQSLLLGAQGSCADGNFSFRDVNGHTRTRKNNEHKSGGGFVRWRIHRDTGTFDFFSQIHGLTRGEPGQEQLENLHASSEQFEQRYAIRAKLKEKHKIATSGGVQLRLKRYRFRDPEPFLAGSTQGFYLSDKDLAADARVLYSEFSAHQIALAAEARYEIADSERNDARDRNESRAHGAVTLSDTWKLSDFRLEGALRLDATSGRSLELVPQIGAAWSPNHKLTVRTNFGRSFRDPSFDELYFEGPGVRGNPDLRSEKGWSGDFGIQWRGPHIEAETALFASTYERMILFARTNPYLLKAQDNYGSKIFGAEANLRVFIKDFEIHEVFTATRAQFAHSPHNPLPYRPTWRNFSEIIWTLGPAHIFASYDCRSEVTTDLFGKRKLDGYGRLDLGTDGRIGLGFRTGLTFTNVLDSAGYDSVQMPLPGRSLLWTLSYEH